MSAYDYSSFRHYAPKGAWARKSEGRCSRYTDVRNGRHKTENWWSDTHYVRQCQRKVYRRVPGEGWVCKRHYWQQGMQTIENVEERTRYVYWKKRQAELETIKSKDKKWVVECLLAELRGDNDGTD